MKRVQILTTRPYGSFFPIVSWLIRIIQFSKESHILWYFPEKKLVRDIHLGEYREIDIDLFMEANKLINVKTLVISEDQYASLDEYTKSKEGKKESWLFPFISFLFLQIFRKLGIKFANPFFKELTSADFIREGSRQIDALLVFIFTKDIPKGVFNTKDAMDLVDQLSERY
jgi:hypothetical protein